MNRYDVIFYQPTEKGEEDRLEHIGEITVRHSCYVMNDKGHLSFRIVADDLSWLSKLQLKHEYIKEFTNGLFLVNSPIIRSLDTFDIFIPKDIEQHEYYDENVGDGANRRCYFYLKLKSRVYKGKGSQEIDISRQLSNCPVCGEPINYFSAEDALMCSNPTCPANRYRDMTRYVKFVLHMSEPSLGPLIRKLIDYEVIKHPEDLYDSRVLPYMVKMIDDLATTTKTERLYEMVNDKKGEAKLGDYISILPVGVAYSLVHPGEVRNGDYTLCPENITKDFNKEPEKFLTMFQNCVSLFMIEDFDIWKEKTASTIERYMSIPLFFEYMKLFITSEECQDASYADTIRQLAELGVFG